MKICSNFYFYIPFWHQKYITTHLKPNLIKGSVVYRDTGFRMDRLFSILKIYTILFNFHLLHVY